MLVECYDIWFNIQVVMMILFIYFVHSILNIEVGSQLMKVTTPG